MDKDSLALVARSITDRAEAIRRAEPQVTPARGRSVVQLVEEVLAAVEAERDRILGELASASEAEADALGRRLLRLLAHVTSVSTLTPYLADVGRRDVSLGLLLTSDVVVDSLLIDGADAVIHNDEHHMYSTLDLRAVTERPLAALGATTEIQTIPLVLFVPGIDPHNALLVPILAHEVGHSAIEEKNLGSEVLSRADLTELNALLDECLRAAGDPDPGPWQVQLFSWIDELLCDALALVLTGPSCLFAAAAFLPAPQAGSLGTHPFPADRIRFALEALRSLGWGDVLDGRVPALTTWLTGVSAMETEPTDPLERFLRLGLRSLESSILEVAQENVADPLAPSDFADLDSRVMELVDAAIPPSQVGTVPVPPWVIVLAGWLYRFSHDGDVAETLASATGDRVFNEYLLKAIEMSRVTSLWGET